MMQRGARHAGDRLDPAAGELSAAAFGFKPTVGALNRERQPRLSEPELHRRARGLAGGRLAGRVRDRRRASAAMPGFPGLFGPAPPPAPASRSGWPSWRHPAGPRRHGRSESLPGRRAGSGCGTPASRSSPGTTIAMVDAVERDADRGASRSRPRINAWECALAAQRLSRPRRREAQPHHARAARRTAKRMTLDGLPRRDSPNAPASARVYARAGRVSRRRASALSAPAAGTGRPAIDRQTRTSRCRSRCSACRRCRCRCLQDDGLPLGLQVVGFRARRCDALRQRRLGARLNSRRLMAMQWTSVALSSPALERYRDGRAATCAQLSRSARACAGARARGPAGRRRRADQQRHRDASAGALAVSRRHCRSRERKAFLFTQPTDAKGRRYDSAVLVAGLAANRDVYRVGFGKPLDEIGADLGEGHRQSDPAALSSTTRPARRSWSRAHDLDQRRPGARRAAGADLDAGLGQCALSLGRPLHHQGSRHRHPERRQLPRPAQGAAAARHESVGRAARRHLRALGEIQGARRADAVRRRGRLPAGHLLRLRAEAAGESRRARRWRARIAGGPINVVRAKTVDLLVPAEAEIVIEGFINTEWLEPEAPFGESHGYVNLQEYNAFMDVTAITRRRASDPHLLHQPGDAERIERHPPGRDGAGLPRIPEIRARRSAASSASRCTSR